MRLYSQWPEWKSVRKYLKDFVGDCYEIESTAEKIYIGGYLPEEYVGSNARIHLPHILSKAKANVSYNIFNARLLINHAYNNKKYLYDIVEIKKEMGRSQHDV